MSSDATFRISAWETVSELIRHTLRPLAFNETGRQYLKQLRQQEVRIASRFAAVPEPYRRLEYRSTQLYASMMAEPDRIALLKKEIGGPIIL